MNPSINILFIIVLALFLMQSVGGYFQMKNYKKAVRRVHQKGNVGIGQRRGRFFNGHLVLISCDRNGTITGGEVLDGITFVAKFHEIKTILGKPILGESIYTFLEEFDSFDKRKRKKHQGYVRALDALRIRLKNEAAERELDAQERAEGGGIID